jgi:hypothetical protein
LKHSSVFFLLLFHGLALGPCGFGGLVAVGVLDKLAVIAIALLWRGVGGIHGWQIEVRRYSDWKEL